MLDKLFRAHSEKNGLGRRSMMRYQHQAGGNHQPPDRQQSMDNCKCTIC